MGVIMNYIDFSLDNQISCSKNMYDSISDKEHKKYLLYKDFIELYKNYSDFDESKYDIYMGFSKCDGNKRFIYDMTEMTINYDFYKACDELFLNSLIEYYKVLYNYYRLALELNITDSLDLSNLFSYMLWNGYYSFNKKHVYSLNDRNNVPGMNFFDIINGGGVCLAYSQLLSDYLSVCGKKSTILCCRLSKDSEIDNHYINRNVDVKNNLIKKLVRMVNKYSNIPNHCINYIYDNDKMFLYDSTNIGLYNICDNKNATIVNGNGNVRFNILETLKQCPWCDKDSIFQFIYNSCEFKELDRRIFINSMYKVLDLVYTNKNILDDAYDNIHSNLIFISEDTKRIGNIKNVRKLVKNSK